LLLTIIQHDEQLSRKSITSNFRFIEGGRHIGTILTGTNFAMNLIKICFNVIVPPLYALLAQKYKCFLLIKNGSLFSSTKCKKRIL